MTHLFHNNKSAGEWLNDISTNTEGLAKSDNTNFNDGDKGSLNLAIKEENFYKIKQKLIPTSPLGNDLFGGGAGGSPGSSMAVYDNFVIIGASGTNSNKGAAYIFSYSKSTDLWTQLQKLEAIDGASNDTFGQSVGIYGNYCIVGATTNNNLGAAYLYEYSSRTSLFEFKSKLLTKENVNLFDFFGISVDIYNDTIAIGAPSWENNRSNNQIGGNWTYTHATQTWTSSAPHGLTVDFGSNKLYFVSSGGGASPFEINKTYYVVNIVNANNLKLSDTDGGSIVTTTGDSSGTWKAAKMDDSKGAVFIWTLSNNVWTETQKLQPDFANPISKNEEQFGREVKIYKNTIIVGARGLNTTERVFIFNKIGNSWEQLVLEDFLHLNITLNNPGIGSGYSFGDKLSLYEDYIIISAQNKTVETEDQSTGSKNQGIVLIYKLQDNNVYQLIQRITEEKSKDNDQFGIYTSMYKDKLAISSQNKTSTTILPGSTSTTTLDNNGKVNIYKKFNEEFIKIQEILSLPQVQSDYIGFQAIKLYENKLFIGASGDKTSITVTNSGANYKTYETFNILAGEANGGLSIGNTIGTGAVKYQTTGIVTEIYITSLEVAASTYSGSFTTSGASDNGDNNLTGTIINSGAVYVYEINKTYNHLNIDEDGGLITSGSIRNNTEFIQSNTGNLPLAVRDDYIISKLQSNNNVMPLQTTSTGALFTSNIVEVENNNQYNLISKLIAYDPKSNDFFGISIDIMRDYIVVGTSNKRDDEGTTEGAVYIYKKSFERYEFIQKIDPELDLENSSFYNNFGCVVRFDQYLNLYVGSSGYHENVSTNKEIGGTWTYDHTGGSSETLWTTSTNHNLSIGDTIIFTTNSSNSSGLELEYALYRKVYYVKTTPSLTTVQLSETNGGAVVTTTVDSNQNWKACKTIDAQVGIGLTYDHTGGIDEKIWSTESVGGNWTYDHTGGAQETLWTTSTNHGLQVNDKIVFTSNNSNSSGLESSYTVGDVYYVKTIPSSTTLQLSSSLGGSIVSTSNDSNQNWNVKLAHCLSRENIITFISNNGNSSGLENSYTEFTKIYYVTKLVNNYTVQLSESLGGSAVTTSNDSNQTWIAVGTPGAVSIFTTKQDLWTFNSLKKHTDTYTLTGENIVNTSHGQQFGNSIATDRRIFIIGAPYGNLSSRYSVGYAYQYGFNNNNFSIEAEIDPQPSGSFSGDLGAYSIAIDGDNLMIGVYGYNKYNAYNGTTSFYKFTESVFDKHSTQPTKGSYKLITGGGSFTRHNSPRMTFDNTSNGKSIAIHKDLAVQGCPEIPHSVGGNWTYDHTGGAQETLWTTSEAHTLLVGDIIQFKTNNGNNSGLENSYSLDRYYFVVTVPNTTTLQLAHTSSGVYPGGSSSIVSTSNDSNQNWEAELSNTGFIVAHIWNGYKWEGSKIFPPDHTGINDNEFSGARVGESVDVHNDTIVVGAPYYDGGESDGTNGILRGIILVYKYNGELYKYDDNGNNIINSPFTLTATIYNKTNNEFFGTQVRIYDNIIISSAIGYNSNQGYVSVYEKNSGFSSLKADKNCNLKTTISNITPGTGSTQLGKTEDLPHCSGDVGVMSLAVRNDALATLVDTDGDYTPLQVNSTGALFNQSNIFVPSETGTVYQDDHGNDLTGTQNLDAGAYTNNSADMRMSSNNLYKDITIYGYTSSSSAKLHFALSDDNSNFYIMADTATLTTIGSQYHFIHSLKDCPMRYIKIYNSDSSNTGNTKLYYIISTHS